MHKLFNKLADEETKFFNSHFLSPVIKGQSIRVRIAGIVVSLSVEEKDFIGWGIYKPISYKSARFIRTPSMSEKREYLDLFPVLRLIVCLRKDNQWFGVPASQSDSRFRVSGLVPINLAEEIQLFEVVQTRFDGVNCWFDSIDQNYNPKTSIYLRESLINLVVPDKLFVSGLTSEEKNAYIVSYEPALEVDIESKKDKQEERIKLTLFKAGAKYKSYIERGNTFTVEYVVDGETHRSVVNKNTLSVESAGICLSGTDRNFDLDSLVGVVKEGIRRRKIVRV